MQQGWVSTREGRHLQGRRKTDTAPELLLRRALFSLGARYRLHRELTKRCSPDLVLPGRRIAVFVDGCWWHSCPRHGRQRPFTGPNASLWTEKMARTRERDRYATQAAQDLGWIVVRLWECEVHADPLQAARRILALNPRSF